MKNCSLSLEEGKLLVILGKSGSGKSTLLRCVYGLEDLINGSISFKNETVLGPAYNLIPGYQSMKLVSQEYYVLDNHTVSENILDKLSGYADEYKQKRLNQLLRILNLLKVKNQIPKQLSSGQRQRVSIARALADFPELLLLDEPFSNLDLPLKDKIFEYIRKSLQQHQASAILVTHQPEEAMRYADIIAVMNEGKIIQYDLPQIIYYKPINTNVAANG